MFENPENWSLENLKTPQNREKAEKTTRLFLQGRHFEGFFYTN
jgi:hypothetical protein